MTSRKRIAIITHGGLHGGHFRQGVPALMGLVETLAGHHDIVAIAANTGPMDEALSLPYRLRTLPGKSGVASTVAAIVREHARRRIDLLHGFWGHAGGRCAVAASRLLRIPAIVSLQGGETAAVDDIGYGALLSVRQTARLARTCRHAAATVALTDFQGRKLVDAGIRPGNLQIVPFGASPEQFPFHERAWGAPWRFLHVANLTEVKDQLTLLRAFDRIRLKVDAQLDIVGPDYLDGQLQRAVRELGLQDHVRFSGPVPHEDLPACYRDAHMLLHSSLYESQAVVAAEAMASGVAVCATRVGLFADLDGRCCVTVPCGDAAALANAALDLLESRKRLNELVRAGHEWSLQHSDGWTANRYLELYDDVTRRR